MRSRSAASSGGGGRRITVIRNQWSHVKNRSTLTGKMVFYGLIVTVLFMYSVALVQFATKSKEGDARNPHGPGELMRDDDDFNERYKRGPMDDFVVNPESDAVNCSWPTRAAAAAAPVDGEEASSAAAKLQDGEDGCFKDANGQAVACTFGKTILDTSKLHMKGTGGEALSSVMGQPEEVEFIESYDTGAFTIPHGTKTPSIADLAYYNLNVAGEENLFFLRPVLASMTDRSVKDSTEDLCKEGSIVDTPTLFIARYEYVNLKSTLSDLFNAYGVSYGSSSSEGGEGTKKFNVVFLDGHPQGSFDGIWPTLFGGTVTHVKKLDKPATCFRRAIFVPAGYMAPIQSMYCTPVPSMMDGFVSHILQRYNLQQVKRVKKKVVIVERVGYVSHPRSDPGSMARVISNLDDLKTAIEKAVPGIAVQIVKPETLTFDKQVEVMRSAEVLIGKFGSGMSNLLFMDEDTLSVELDPEAYNLYTGFSDWKGSGHAHLQFTTNILSTENVGALDKQNIDKIVAAVKEKVNCNLWEGNVISAMYNELRCKKKNAGEAIRRYR